MTYFTHQFVVNIHNLHRGQMSHCVLFADLMSLNTMACYTKKSGLPRTDHWLPLQISPSGSPDKAFVSTSNVSPVVLVLR